MKTVLNITTLLFSLLLIADLIIGIEAYEEKIVSYKNYTQHSYRGSGTRKFGIITDKDVYPLNSTKLIRDTNEGDTIKIFKTPLLKEVIRIEHKQTIFKDPSYSIYNSFFILPILFILSSFIACYAHFKYNIEHFDIYTLVSGLLFLLSIISMITNNFI